MRLPLTSLLPCALAAACTHSNTEGVAPDLAVTSSGEAALALCEGAGDAALTSAEEAWSRIILADPYVAWQASLSSSLLTLALDQQETPDGQPDCLTLNQEGDLTSAQAEGTCEFSDGTTWTGGLTVDFGTTEWGFDYDQLEVEGEMGGAWHLALDGSGLGAEGTTSTWSTSLEIDIEDETGLYSPANSWTRMLGSFQFEMEEATEATLSGRSTIVDTDADTPFGTACVVGSSSLPDGWAVAGAALVELQAQTEEEDCFDVWMDGEADGSWCR